MSARVSANFARPAVIVEITNKLRMMTMHAFTEKIDTFRWLDLDGAHGTLRVWQQDGVMLVLFTDDDSGRTYVLSEQPIGDDQH